jgi:Methionine gamma-lyase
MDSCGHTGWVGGSPSDPAVGWLRGRKIRAHAGRGRTARRDDWSPQFIIVHLVPIWQPLIGSSFCSETRVALVQRSCGYSLRPTLSIADIEQAVRIIKAQSPSCVVAVDNCYGEFTEDREPCSVSAGRRFFFHFAMLLLAPNNNG